jgi:hypothetical protein
VEGMRISGVVFFQANRPIVLVLDDAGFFIWNNNSSDMGKSTLWRSREQLALEIDFFWRV